MPDDNRQQQQRGGPKIIAADAFFHHIDFLALAVGVPTPGSFQVDADSDFRLVKLSYFADIAGALQTSATRVLPLVTVQIQDNKTGRYLSVDPIPIPAMMGDGQLPFLLPRQKLFPGNSVVKATVNSFAVAGTIYNLRLVFTGEKIYYE